MSSMTASTSKSTGQQHTNSVHASRHPDRFVSQPKSGQKKRKIGKEKERESNPPPAQRRNWGSESEWDHSKAGTQPWSWISLTEASASKNPPLFTKDGSYFFSIVGASIKIYSSATGQVVSTLSGLPPNPDSAGHSDTITSAILNPNNAFQLITGSLNGYIQIWDFIDAVLLQTISIEQPIFHLCAHEKFTDSVFVAASKASKNKNSNGYEKESTGVVLRISLKPRASTVGSKIQTSSEITSVGKTRSTVGLGFSPSGEWLVAVAGHKAYVAATSSLKSGFTKYVSPEALTCLAFHPSEDYFATGDSKGNIRMWYCLEDLPASKPVGVEKRAQTTTLHWHAHALSSLCFTPNGAYLLSGGEESVLVIWQLHTGKKEFVPRVGAPISTIAVSKGGESEEYLLGLADASFTFVSAATLKISRSYSRIKLDPEASYTSSSPSSAAPLAVHSATSTLILPSSHPSSLQTYAPSTSTLIAELEVSPSNRVSRRDDIPIEPSRVEYSVVSSSGEWMATIDGRVGDDSFRGEVYLKIWWWDPKSGFWILNTRIDRPHGLERVTSIAFSPDVKNRLSLQLVTVGDDCTVRTWRLRTMTDKNSEIEESWVARSSFGFRGERPTHVSWSPDGSLFCIPFGPCAAVYDSASNSLRRILSTPSCKSVSSAQFIGRSGRFLVSVGTWDIVLWDLAVQSVRWHHKSPWPIDKILPHPHDDSFAILHCPSISPRSRKHTTPITILTPSSPTAHRKLTVPFGFLNVAWHASSTRTTPRISSAYKLVGISNSYSVVLFGDDISAPSDEGLSANSITDGATSTQKRTLFQDVFGASSFSGSLKQPDSVPGGTSLPWSGKEVAGMFDAPAYLMPPIESLFEPLIDSFIQPRQNELGSTQGTLVLEHLNEDVDMAGQSDDESQTTGMRSERVVDDNEMDMLVDLFRHNKVGSSVSSRPSTNGHSKPHQPSPSIPKINGSKPHNAPTAVTDSAVIPKDPSSLNSTPAGKHPQKRRRPSDGP